MMKNFFYSMLPLQMTRKYCRLDTVSSMPVIHHTKYYLLEIKSTQPLLQKTINESRVVTASYYLDKINYSD